ncbi:hypothetical protein JCM3775_001661 [Rhodotorula graminis]
MAPAGTTNAAGRPKRKRQRRRRANADSDDDLDLSSSSSDAGSSSASDDSDSDADTPTTTSATAATTAPAKAAAASSSSSSSDDDDAGADSDSSSGSDLSFLSDGGGDLGGRGRRGRGRRRAAEGQEAAAKGAGGAAAPGSAPHAAAAQARRPYPERSPSPSMLARADPSAFVPLGTSLFPLLDKRVPKAAATTTAAGEEDGAEAGSGRVLEGLVEGDEAVADGQAKEEDGKKREDRFGEWWRARLVSEFEGDLGGLAAEPGLTPSRLQLLLTSLTTLSSLHTSSALPPSARSIWAHDASATLDPLATLPASATGDDLAEWATTRVGGAGDVEVGEEGVVDDERRSAKHKAKKERRKSAPVPEAVKMVVEAEGAAAPASSPAKKDKKEKKRKGRKSGVSEAGDNMEVDE